jgi:hypothetical protein
MNELGQTIATLPIYVRNCGSNGGACKADWCIGLPARATNVVQMHRA